MKALLYKDNKQIKVFSDITRVDVDEKYGYFTLYQKIFKHTIIFVKPFKEVDKIVTQDKGDFGRIIEKTYIPFVGKDK